MGEACPPAPVQLIAGLLGASGELLDEAREVLAREFGTIAAASEPYRWTESTYYAAEMGSEIWRQFLGFAVLIDPGDLAAVKRRTNEIEGRWRGAGGRLVNVDPGYLDATKLVLASTKDAAHRVYLRDGIFAEATLHYAGGSWRPYPHSYRDYASPATVAFFNTMRAGFLAQRRARAAESDVPATGARPPDAAPGRRSRAAAPK